MRLLPIVLAFAILVSSASVHPSVRDACGLDAQLIDEKTFQHGGKEIKILTKSCPGLAELGNVTTSDTLEKRQISQCSSTCKFISEL
jgi:hypothetical protein